jgi:diacylglycerol kinase family enzyme
MRGLLVVNPVATATTQRARDVLASALAADLTLETVITKGRGHAVEMGQRAAETGTDVVIALGGDGTVNEIVNGLLHAGPAPDAPMLAVVPGGSTNVFARALGYSASPVEATGELLDAVRQGVSRRISVGHASYGDRRRWFVFCAGMGLDAEVVAQVERKREGGRPNNAGLFLRSAAGRFVRGGGRARATITVHTESAEPEDVRVALVCNTRPWTYLNGRPVLACPAASFDTGLDLVGLRRIRLVSALRAGAHMLFGEKGPHGRNIVSRHDEPSIRLAASDPTPFQVDGEYLGECAEVDLTCEARALRVVGPPQ